MAVDDSGSLPVHDIDHVDTNPFNNSWSNLREAGDGENSANRPNWRKSKLKWVYEHRGGYHAKVRHAGKLHYLEFIRGTEQDAHDAAYAFAQQTHKQFTRI